MPSGAMWAIVDTCVLDCPRVRCFARIEPKECIRRGDRGQFGSFEYVLFMTVVLMFQLLKCPYHTRGFDLTDTAEIDKDYLS